MMKWIILILNLPYTLLGIILTILSIPYQIKIIKNPIALIFQVKSFWWIAWYWPKARAVTIGHIILLSPKEKENDLEHEIIHVKQYTRYPLIYPVLYYWESFKKGYRMNRFEDEAYKKSKSFYNGVRQG